jgi:KTSC domain
MSHTRVEPDIEIVKAKDSSFIKEFGYASPSRTLGVTLQNGLTYTYIEVPRNVFTRFKEAKSKGRFYNTHVRGKFEGPKK